MSIYRDPDEVIKEVEENEVRREEAADVEKELDDSPKDHDPEDGED
jgi:hypothetical protein